MGLHLGWIPNEPGLRPRDFAQQVPSEAPPDPAKVAALHKATHARGMWARLLVVVGLFALLLFGLIGTFTRVHLAWAVAGVLAVGCWLPLLLLVLNGRRAAAGLRAETEQRFRQHSAELAEYEQGKALWARSEAERVAAAPRWLQVAAHEDTSRLDVFGGTGRSRQNMVTGQGWELLADHAVIVLDLSQDRVADGLLSAALRAGLSCQDYQLPRDLGATPLLAGLTGEQVASLIVEVVHADDASATAAGRATDLMILKKITGVLGADVSMGRLHAALTTLLGDGPHPADSPAADSAAGPAAHPGAPPGGQPGPLSADEQAGLRALFGAGFRHQVAGNLVRLAAVVEPLTALGTAAEPRPARLTCLSLADGPRDVATDLTAALVIQWVTRAVSDAERAGGGPDGAGPARPAVILAGADEQSTRHLARLTAVCERYGIPLVRAFSRLTEESARHLDTRHTAFLRLATRAEALRAAEHIGLERRFVAGRFAHRHSVSRSRTRTSSESVTHTTGRTEGGAQTHTTGTTTGQAYSEAEVPRHTQQLEVKVEESWQRDDRDRGGRREPERGGGREPSGREPGAGRDGGGGDRRGGEQRPRSGSGGGNSGGGGGRSSGSRKLSVLSKPGKTEMDIVKTRTQFSAQHESDSTTKSWSTSEETSHTSGTSRSRTDGVSVGDEISYELVYDHKVQPETLMALPEDQMLAPHIVESAAARAAVGAAARAGAGAGAVGSGRDAVTAGASGLAGTATESKMVALLIDPAVVGSEAVAPVHPSEIPAFEPPAPAVSGQVPDYERVKRPALDPGH